MRKLQCPEPRLIRLMECCWAEETHERPPFAEIVKELEILHDAVRMDR
jgi:hypothetical protein